MVPRAMRICFFGDSFVNGTGDDDALGWVGRLVAGARRRGRDVTCYNLGVRRDTSADVADRWMREARVRLPPDCDGRLVFSAFHGVTPGTKVSVDVAMSNTFLPETADAQLFQAKIQVASNGCLVLDEHAILILVPPSPLP